MKTDGKIYFHDTEGHEGACGICQYVRNDTQGKIPNAEHSVYNNQHTKSYPTVLCVKTTTQSQRYSLQTLILLFITYRSLKFLSCYLH
jgi:hypothetical protein